MRITTLALLLVSVALAACQGGQRISKAANVPQTEVGEHSTVVAGTGDSNCMQKCVAKAEDKHAKCLKSNAADVCSDAQVERILKCNDHCATPP